MVKASLFAAWNQCLLVKIQCSWSNPPHLVLQPTALLNQVSDWSPTRTTMPQKLFTGAWRDWRDWNPRVMLVWVWNSQLQDPLNAIQLHLLILTLQHLSVSAINMAPSFWIRSALDWRYFSAEQALVIGAPYGETWQSHLTFHDTVGPLEIRTYDINTWFRCLGIRYGNIM